MAGALVVVDVQNDVREGRVTRLHGGGARHASARADPAAQVPTWAALPGR